MRRSNRFFAVELVQKLVVFHQMGIAFALTFMTGIYFVKSNFSSTWSQVVRVVRRSNFNIFVKNGIVPPTVYAKNSKEKDKGQSKSWHVCCPAHLGRMRKGNVRADRPSRKLSFLEAFFFPLGAVACGHSPACGKGEHRREFWVDNGLKILGDGTVKFYF